MTLPPEKVGDKGQRYEVKVGYSNGTRGVFGWADTMEGAEKMLESIRLWPAAVFGSIVDREAVKIEPLPFGEPKP